MRQSIGGAWLLGLVATFILLFTSFLAIAINYTRAFKVKNEVIDFIEREEGLTSRTGSDDGAVQLINNYLSKSAYSEMGKCDASGGWYGMKRLDIFDPQPVQANDKYYYCVKKITGYDSVYQQKGYYKIVLFFNFDIPIFGEIFTYQVNGATTQIMHPADNLPSSRQ